MLFNIALFLMFRCAGKSGILAELLFRVPKFMWRYRDDRGKATNIVNHARENFHADRRDDRKARPCKPHTCIYAYTCISIRLVMKYEIPYETWNALWNMKYFMKHEMLYEIWNTLWNMKWITDDENIEKHFFGLPLFFCLSHKGVVVEGNEWKGTGDDKGREWDGRKGVSSRANDAWPGLSRTLIAQLHYTCATNSHSAQHPPPRPSCPQFPAHAPRHPSPAAPERRVVRRIPPIERHDSVQSLFTTYYYSYYCYYYLLIIHTFHDFTRGIINSLWQVK